MSDVELKHLSPLGELGSVFPHYLRLSRGQVETPKSPLWRARLCPFIIGLPFKQVMDFLQKRLHYIFHTSLAKQHIYLDGFYNVQYKTLLLLPFEFLQ